MRITRSKIIQVITLTVILLITANIKAADTRDYISCYPINNLTERDISLMRSWYRGYEPVQFTQPDGTEITLYESPEGHHKSKLTDENNYRVALNGNTWYYCWVMQDEDGGLYASQYPVHLYTPESLGLQPGLTETPEYNLRRIEQEKEAEEWLKRNNEEYRRQINLNEIRGSIRNDADTPHEGVVNSLVFFIIPDSTGSDFLRTWSEYDSVLNNLNGNSLRIYYKDGSNANLDIFLNIRNYRDTERNISYFDTGQKNYENNA